METMVQGEGGRYNSHVSSEGHADQEAIQTLM